MLFVFSPAIIFFIYLLMQVIFFAFLMYTGKLIFQLYLFKQYHYKLKYLLSLKPNGRT